MVKHEFLSLKILFFLSTFRDERNRIFVLNEKNYNLNKIRRRSTLILSFLVISIFAFSSCKTDAPSPETKTPHRKFLDDREKKITLPVKVDRAISLAPNITEIAFAVGAGDRLVGVTTFCNYPQEAKKIQKVGDTLKPNIENIIALKPQVVFVSTASQLEAFTETLEKQGIAVFVTNPSSFKDIYKSIETIGGIFGESEKSKEVVEDMKKRIARVEEIARKADKVKTFVQIDKSLYTIGKESFLTDLISKAGGDSVTKDVETAFPKISKEKALAMNPEAIILSESPDNDEPNEVFKNSAAVKNGKVFNINADILSRPGPRLVDALEQIAKTLHPEKFK